MYLHIKTKIFYSPVVRTESLKVLKRSLIGVVSSVNTQIIVSTHRLSVVKFDKTISLIYLEVVVEIKMMKTGKLRLIITDTYRNTKQSTAVGYCLLGLASTD